MTQQNNLLSQKGMVIWLLGLSGAGKSTIATLIKEKLDGENYVTVLLDGDQLRAGLNKNLSFSNEDRAENVRRAAEIAKILVGNHVITICSLITPLQEHRDLARAILGDAYFEVFIDCPLEICEERDTKGLYKKARTQALSNFTGITSSFEPSMNADITLYTNAQTPRESCELLYRAILTRITAV